MKPTPLTDTEKAYFDTIRQVVRSPRPQDLALYRMFLDEREVAVVAQRLLDSGTAEEAGWMPLAVLVDQDMVQRLRTVDGRGLRPHDPSDLEGAG